jgi:hypothetical protein
MHEDTQPDQAASWSLISFYDVKGCSLAFYDFIGAITS